MKTWCIVCEEPTKKDKEGTCYKCNTDKERQEDLMRIREAQSQLDSE